MEATSIEVSAVRTWFPHVISQNSGSRADRRSTVSCSLIEPSSVVEVTNSKLTKRRLFPTACLMASKIFTIVYVLTGKKDPSDHLPSCVLFVNEKRVRSCGASRTRLLFGSTL